MKVQIMAEYSFATSPLLTTRDIFNFIDYCVQETLSEKKKFKPRDIMITSKELMEHFNITKRRLDYLKELGIPRYRLDARRLGYKIEEVNKWLTDNNLWEYLALDKKKYL